MKIIEKIVNKINYHLSCFFALPVIFMAVLNIMKQSDGPALIARAIKLHEGYATKKVLSIVLEDINKSWIRKIYLISDSFVDTVEYSISKL